MNATLTRLFPGWLAALLFLALPLTAPAAAQKNDTRYREFPAYGFEFKPLKEFSDVPVGGRLAAEGIVGQFESERGPQAKYANGKRGAYPCALYVYYLKPEGPESGEASGEREVDERRTAKDFVLDRYAGAVKEDGLEVEVSELKASKTITGERAEVVGKLDMTLGNESTDLEVVFDVYTFVHGHAKVIFLWDYPADKKTRGKWSKAVEKSMKSFQLMKEGATTVDVTDVNSDSSYEDLLTFHQNDVEQTPGWRLVETPSKQYLIKTNEDKDKYIKEVILRLEASRELYEEDFPPAAPITQISVVRVCATESDFHTYGGTSSGVAGWFNPGTEELVLYFGDGSKDETMSVMAHEGFHQYCHFLFGRAEAHRWFDEGHGDYYGAWKMKGKKLIQDDDMKGGLSRVPVIKEMMRNDDIKPLSKHIRYDHGQWQNQGPSNVSCYAQSFALVFFLREGTKGNVKRKYWKDEYADIIPSYMATLKAGFDAAYEEVRKEGQEALDALAELDPEDVDPDHEAGARDRVEKPWKYARADKQEIWDAAMEASWGKIDEEEFEERWLSYVDDVL